MFRGDRDRAKALEEALERLRADPKSTALGDEELERLASLAMEVQRELDVPGPSAAFRRTSRARIVRAMRTRQAQRERPAAPAWRPRGFPRLSYVLASLAVAVALVTSGAGVAQAAENALPGDVLYGVKQGIEKGRLLFTFSAQGDMELLSEFASQRLWEVERLIELGRTEQVDGTVLEYERLLDNITALAPQVEMEGGSQPLVQVESRLQNHIQVLERVLSQVPEKAQPAIEKALDRSSHSQEVLQQIQEGESPSEVAPGQLKKTQQPLDAEETLEAGPEEPPQGPQKTPGPAESPPGQSKDKQKDKKPHPPHPNPGHGREGAPGQQD